MSTEKPLIPRPSAKQWAVLCTIVGLVVPLLASGAWQLAQKAANTQLKETIAAAVQPVMAEIQKERDERTASDADIRKAYLELTRYAADQAKLDSTMRDIATKTDVNYREILAILREQNKQITEIAVQVSKTK